MRFLRLGLGGRLDRYVGGLFVASYATALLLVVGLVLIMDLAANLDYFEPWEDGTRVSGLLLLRYYALNVPFLFLQVAPFVTVVAGLFTIVRLQKKNELVAALSAGVSAHRVMLPVFCGGLVAAGAMFVLREGATATLGERRDALHDVLENERYERVLDKFWIRDTAGNAVRIGEFRPASGEIRGLEAHLNESGVWITIRADRALWRERTDGVRGWRLENGRREDVGTFQEQHAIEWLEVIDFTPHDVLVAQKGREREMELSFSETLELAARDPDDMRYQTLLQYHLTFPLANLVLLLVALPFLMGRERGHGAEGLVAGCLMCVLYFCIDFVTRSLGMDGTLSPLMASWLPVLLFGSLGAALVHSMRS